MSSGDGHPDAVTNTEERHSLGLSHFSEFCFLCQRDSLQERITAAEKYAVAKAAEAVAATQQLADARLAQEKAEKELASMEEAYRAISPETMEKWKHGEMLLAELISFGHQQGLLERANALERGLAELREALLRIGQRAAARPVHICDVDTFDLETIENEVFELLRTTKLGRGYLHFTQIPSVLTGTWSGEPFPENNKYEEEMNAAEHHLVTAFAPLYGFVAEDKKLPPIPEATTLSSPMQWAGEEVLRKAARALNLYTNGLTAPVSEAGKLSLEVISEIKKLLGE